MRIKHWAGYGLVNATKVGERMCGGKKTLVIRVSGNHERGLERGYNDTYCIFNWLVKKFDKSVKDDAWMGLTYTTNDRYEKTDNEYGIIEICDYTITY